jgi:Reverse transcriptase (RNA-dependent DNA polymerase)/Integrase core domain/GAG-pre-integrase domain
LQVLATVYGGNKSTPAGVSSMFSDKECFHCHEVGHLQYDCPKLSADEKQQLKNQRQQRFQRNQQHRSYGTARGNYAAAHMAAMAALHDDIHDWLVDSGAQFHMSPHRCLFFNYRPIAEFEKDVSNVEVANGKFAPILGFGDVHVYHRANGFLLRHTLRNVLHVPDLKVNLFSVGTWAALYPVDMSFEAAVCLISCEGKIRFEGHLANGLFWIRGADNTEPYIIEDLIRDVPPGGAAPSACAATVSSDLELLHRRLGHLGVDNIEKLVKGKMVTGLTVGEGDFKHNLPAPLCDPCAQSKLSRASFPHSDSKTGDVLELVHMDLCGPYQVESLGGAKYVATFLDDFSRLSVVRTLARKSDVSDAVQEVLVMLETQSGKRVKRVRTDRGGEYVNNELGAFFKRKGIVHETTAPYTPQQNGKAERLNRTLNDRVRAMLIDADVHTDLWGEAMFTANYIRNRSPSAGIDRTPWETFYGEVPDLSMLRVFGSRAIVHIPRELRAGKLSPRGEEALFLGYEPASKAYRLLLSSDGRIVVSRDVVFDEGVKSGSGAVMNAAPHDDRMHVRLLPVEQCDLDDMPPLMPVPDADSGSDSEDTGDEVDGEGGDGLDSSAESNIDSSGGSGTPPSSSDAANDAPRRSDRVRRAPGEWWAGNVQALKASVSSSVDSEPLTVAEALACDESEMWQQAMNEELASLYEHDTWTVESVPVGVKPLPCKWVFKRKLDALGNIERYKARLVAKGFRQVAGVDYDEVYAPVSKHSSLRALLSVVADQDLVLQQLDVKTAFLNGEIEEEIWLCHPPGFEQGAAGTACRLKKALYGLKQAPRAWHQKLKEELLSLGFTESDADPSLFILQYKDRSVYVLVYVDDMLIAAKDTADVSSVKEMLMSIFEARDLGDAKLFLGMEIERDRGAGTLKLSQKKYAHDVIARFGMADAKPASLPLSPGVKLSRDTGSPLDVLAFPYREVVGSLMYLSVCTRPDISQAVGALARYMSCPMKEHWDAAKAVLRYVKSSTGVGIQFGGSKGLQGYCDSDYAGDIDTRRSTTGYAFVLNGGVISWSSRLQPTVAVSTTEAEYMSASSAVKEALWLRKLFVAFGIDATPVQMFCDNQAAIKLIKHPIASMRSKHIDVQHHFVRERAARGEVMFQYCPSSDMIADCMTKPLALSSFQKCLEGMGVVL